MIYEVLLPWTSEDVNRVIMLRVVLMSAEPAPAVSTSLACHMVAAGDLLYPSFTLGTVSDVSIP
jgi:hypothetical protein